VSRIDVLGGRYRLDHLLGQGGMGAVWAGHDTILNRPVAVKMLRDDLGPGTKLQRDRLLAEARAAAAVRHPNLVSTFDAVTDDGTFALVMERLPGPSLADRLADGPLNAAEARTLALDVLGGLAAVHGAGLVHRDVKPANVLRSADGRWMLVDFGVAKNLLIDDHLTATGTTVGTPAYLAPEQLHGQQATPSTDLWAVGVMLYEALSGRLPFSGDTAFAIAYSVQTATPEPLSALLPDADPAITDTVERALRKSAEDRFHSATAMAESLRPRVAGDVVAALAPARPDPADAPVQAEPAIAPAPPDPADVAADERERGLEGLPVAVGADAPASDPSRHRALAFPLVAASLIMAVVMAVTLGGGDDGTGTARPSSTSAGQSGDAEGGDDEGGDGDGASASAGATPDADGTSPTSAIRSTGRGSRRSTATNPVEPATEDASSTTPSTTGTPTTAEPGPRPGPRTPTTPSTTTSTTTTTTTSTTTTTVPPVTLPDVTIPELPIDIRIGGEPLLPSSPR
jgi:serine/threonine-protein kinase